jgi:hypothetical protein
LVDERNLRLRLTDSVVELKGGVRIHVVPKPRELDTSSRAPVHSFSSHAVTIRDDDGTERCFNAIDYVHTPTTTTNDDVWRDCEPFVDGVFKLPQRRLLMLAHGRTGAGKTHLMAQGMIPRTLARIFHLKQQRDELGDPVGVEATSVEIYNEEAIDDCGIHLTYSRLPTDDTTNTTTTTDRFEARYAVESHTPGIGSPTRRTPLPSLVAATAFLERVRKQRETRTHPTLFNTRSSRSHLVVAFFGAVTQGANGQTSEGSIHLVDLAGNEGMHDATHGPNGRERWCGSNAKRYLPVSLLLEKSCPASARRAEPVCTLRSRKPWANASTRASPGRPSNQECGTRSCVP